ncbi:insulin-degrading enzyme-like [Metopolophium dirhodum]|uniref:insulin-degrading enzyme-like n=1 Tax=Metopolophium dirhodum TaxID=44670 RepID=UPI00298F8C0F|nr:insulin-degrading enzyme-like [Metopolophium dirhodum]
MLIMGTKKYPGENEFSQFIAKNGGYYSAYTAIDHTNYYCSSKTDELRPLLDRFSRFFFEPLFTASSAEKEINAINSEHEKNKADDNWRLEQLKRSLSVPNHPFNMFGTGTKQTLWDIPKKKKIKICRKLLKFYSKWYSSHLMNLAVLGKEDLTTLEDMVVSLFKHIKKKNINLPTWTDPIYKKEQLATKTIVVPIKDIRQLIVNFLLKDQQPFYKAMPIDYLNALFGDKGPTSISAILMKKGWSTGVLANNIVEARGIEYYEIYVELTEVGLDHVDDIVKLIFQYVIMLKRNGPEPWFHEETKVIKAIEFYFKDKESPLPYVCTITPRMIRYKIRDCLIAEHLIEEWKPELITELMTYFTPDNMRITVVSKTYQNQTYAVDPYYGTRYSVLKIPEKTLNNWRNAKVSEDFKIPSRNEYIANKFSIVPIGYNKSKIPQIFYSSSIIRCWLNTDTVFRLPKAYISVEFYSPIVAIDPLNCNIMDIFVRLFNEDFSQHTCVANRAILHSKIKSRIFGFNIKFDGFNHKMHHLVRRTIAKLLAFKIDPKRLEIIKEEKIRELNNIKMEQPYLSAMRYSSLILSEVAWSPFELLRFIDNINANDVRHFIDKFLSHMFIEAMLYGNVDKQMASILIYELKRACLTCVGFRPLLPQEMIRSREVEMDDGESKLYERVSYFHSSSCVYVNLQCGIQSTKDNMVVSLFKQIIEESCYNILRTQEQLGYVVMSLSGKSNGVLYVGILVQSSHSPTFVHTRIENYLSTVEELLNDLSEDDFSKNKDSLSIKLAEKPKSQSEQAAIFRSEIKNHYYNFNRAKIEVEELRSITKSDIIDFYNEKISRTGSKRRKLAVHIKSSMNDAIDKLKSTSNLPADKYSLAIMNVQKIKDIIEFKKSHRLYPVPKSFIPIETTPIKLLNDDPDILYYGIPHGRRRNEFSTL